MEQKQLQQDDIDYYKEKDRIGDFIETVILKKPHQNPQLLIQLMSPKFNNQVDQSYVEKDVETESISDAGGHDEEQ